MQAFICFWYSLLALPTKKMRSEEWPVLQAAPSLLKKVLFEITHYIIFFFGLQIQFE